MRFTLATISAFVAAAAAIKITSPAEDQNVDLSKSTTIRWTTVNSDASSFSLYLVDMHTYPPVQKLIAENVKTSDGSYTMSGVSGVTDGSNYQINFMSTDSQNTGILAQSQQFDISGGSSSSSATTSGATSTGTGKTTTDSTTGTATTTAASASTTSASGSSSASTTVTLSGSTTLATSTSTGTHTGSTATGTHSASSSAHASSTESSAPTTTPNAAAGLVAPATAGSFLMGLFALAFL